jgi:serine/threonine protein kinase
MSSDIDDLPSRIDRYEPLKKLATGGMAELFLAKQSGLEGFEKVVVLKRILAHLAQDEEFVSMFLDEARIAAKLSHPNIVQIYDLGKADDSYYIAMEYVSGRNVQALINKAQEQDGKLPVEHVCRVVAGVCDGLYYAHSRKDYDGKPLNIIHRDISPQNILVSFAGGVKVVDFGIAKASTQLAQTRAGVLKGKYAYMSPEQVRGAKIDHRSDIFAVGLVFYEMLTGTRAFERESSLKTLKAIVQEKPLNPRELNPEVPMEVIKLLSKALEKNPDRRYKTAQEFQLAIEDYLETSPKKSNNVRLSRYLYDLFDDELNSAEGTLVVKGVGQVIIPTSSQAGEKAKPAIEEEVDHKTLTAALAPEGRRADRASPLVRDEQSSRLPAPPAKSLRPSSMEDDVDLSEMEDEDEDDDDVSSKTVPAYDLADYEAHRSKMGGAHQHVADDSVDEDAPTLQVGAQDIEAAKQMAAARQAESRRNIPARPQRSMPPGPVTDQGSDPLLADPDDKTTAGVPLGGTASDDAHAREMLRRVEAMAPPPPATVSGEIPREPQTASLPDEPPVPQPRAESLRPRNPTVPMMGAVTNHPGHGYSTQEASGAVLPQHPRHAHHPGRPPERSGGTMPVRAAPGPQGAHATAESSALQPSLPPRRPPVFWAMVGASAGMTVVALLLLLVAAVALPGGAPVVEFGVVALRPTLDNARITVDGVEVATGGQFPVPIDGQEHIVQVQVEGKPPVTKTVQLSPGQDLLSLDIVFPAQG